MNAADMTVALRRVYGALDMSFYNSLVASGSVYFSEFSSASQNLLRVVEILEKTPPEKIEAFVAEYNEELTAQLDKFNAVGQQDFLGRFRAAQTMTGYATTIINRAGIRG